MGISFLSMMKCRRRCRRLSNGDVVFVVRRAQRHGEGRMRREWKTRHDWSVAWSIQKNTGPVDAAPERMDAEPDCGLDPEGLGFCDEYDTMEDDCVNEVCMVGW